jgi:uncharacterized protein
MLGFEHACYEYYGEYMSYRTALNTTLLLLLSVLGTASCSDEQELAPCGDGGHLFVNYGMDGNHHFCRLPGKIAHGDYHMEDNQGIILITGEFDQGLPSGQWVWWHKGGLVVEREGNFKLGHAHGLWKEYDENGTQRWEHHYSEGVGCGTWKEWDEQGELILEQTYQPCDDSDGWTAPEGVVMAPDVEYGWAGKACPPGAVLNQSSPDVNASWCQKQGVRHGDFARWYPGTNDGLGSPLKQVEGFFDEGKRTGIWTIWNIEGAVLSQGEFKDDLEEGHWHWWQADGMPVEAGEFANGQRTGSWTGWFASGHAKWTGEYNNGNKDGQWDKLRPGGTVEEKATWKDGLLDGVYENFFESGAPFEKGQYLTGHRNGAWQGLWEKGQPYYEGEYKEGFRHGLWKWFDSDGLPSTEGMYDAQNPVGDWTIWVADTATGLTLMGTGPYDYGIRHGVWTFLWEAAGTLESEVLYLSDLREGPWTSYWPDGNVRIEGYFLSGVGEYLWQYWYQNGQMMTQHTLHEGERSGEATTWYDDGQMKSYGAYSQDKKVGVWTYWDEEGNETTEEFDAWGYPK